MLVVKNSPRALAVALIPLAAVHAVLSAMSLLKIQALPSLLALPSPDRIFVLYVLQLAFDGALIYVCHLALRQRAISSRMAYALMGAVAAAMSYAIVLHNALLLAAPDPGSRITAGLLPAFAGMLSGFLYCQFAGVEPAAAYPRFSDEALATLSTFDGPVRVRTSVAATAIAAVIPAAIAAILSLTFIMMFVPPGLAPPGAAPIFAAALPAQIFITALVATIVPSAILIVGTHQIARALHLRRGFEYAALGSATTLLCAMIFSPLSPFTSTTLFLGLAIVLGALMGGLYRRFAGLEPVPLPEPVIVTDVSTLVSAEHSSRRGHRVVLTD